MLGVGFFRRFSAKPKVLAVLGSQWGDEGKGKLVDVLAKDFDYVARFNGGANAGHTVEAEGHKLDFHMLPSGLIHKNVINIIGNGVVVHMPTLFREIDSVSKIGINFEDRLFISDRAHLSTHYHLLADEFKEKFSEKPIGTTKRGIGPTYVSKMNRNGLRMGDLLHMNDGNFEKKYMALVSDLQSQYGFKVEKSEIRSYIEFGKLASERLQGMIVDTNYMINNGIRQGKSLLAEGANAVMLDIDFGTYPYVTSSNTSAGGICTGLGVPPQWIDVVYGVCKAYLTRVGEGPFPTELKNDLGDKIRTIGREYGVTTGRPRRCGWFDAVQMKYSVMINNYDAINITKLDVLTGIPEIKVGVAYKIDGVKVESFPSSLEDLSRAEVQYETFPGWNENISQLTQYSSLPENAKKYVEALEHFIGVPVKWVGVGPKREQMLIK